MSGLRIRIPQLPESAQPNGSELIEAVQGGQSRRVLLGRASVIPLPDITALGSLDPDTLIDGQRFSVQGGRRVWEYSWNAAAAAFEELTGTGGAFTTEMFGGDPEALQKAISAATAEGVSEVLVTESNDMGGREVEVPSGLTLRAARPSVVLANVRFTSSGSLGPPVAVTSALAPGDRTFSVANAAAFQAGQDVRLVSALNSNSEDAGGLRLGDREGDDSHFAEFAVVESVAGNEVTLTAPVAWTYPLSGDLPQSLLYPVDFNDDVQVLVNSTWSGPEYAVELRLCRNSRVSGHITSSAAGAVALKYCKDTHIVGGRYENTTPNSIYSQSNPVKFRSCMGCTVQRADVRGGHQGADVTYMVRDEAHGGPSMFCKILGCTFRGQTTDAATSHEGCWATEFAGNVGICRQNGIRIRSPLDSVHDNVMFGQGGGNAYFIEGHIVAGSRVSNNSATNFGATITQSRAPLFEGSAACLVERNEAIGCGVGFRTLLGAGRLSLHTRVVDNYWSANPAFQEFTRGVSLSAYSCGVTVRNNTSVGASDAGVRWSGNSPNLVIEGNRAENLAAGAFGIGSFSVSAFITDLGTFPEGEAEARLRIRGNTTDGTGTPFGPLVRNPECYKSDPEWGYSQFSTPIAPGRMDGSLPPSSMNLYVRTDRTPRELRAWLSDGFGGVIDDILIAEYGE